MNHVGECVAQLLEFLSVRACALGDLDVVWTTCCGRDRRLVAVIGRFDYSVFIDFKVHNLGGGVLENAEELFQEDR